MKRKESEITKAKNKERTRLWHLANSNKVKAHRRNHYLANSDKIKKRAKDFRLANPEHVATVIAKFKLENKEHISLQRKINREKNKDKINKTAKLKRLENPEHVAAKKKRYYQKHKANILKINSARKKKRYVTHPETKIADNLRGRIRLALKGNPKLASTLSLIGCTKEFLKEYLEEKFKNGMTWKNHGIGEDKWHIDHIKPLSSFNLLLLEEQKLACHYTNLQPLWSLDNLRKGSKIIHPLAHP